MFDRLVYGSCGRRSAADGVRVSVGAALSDGSATSSGGIGVTVLKGYVLTETTPRPPWTGDQNK